MANPKDTKDAKKTGNGDAKAPETPASEAPAELSMGELKAQWEAAQATVAKAEKDRVNVESTIAARLHALAKESAGKAPGVTPSVLLNGKRYVANKARDTEEITLRKVADRSFAEV